MARQTGKTKAATKAPPPAEGELPLDEPVTGEVVDDEQAETALVTQDRQRPISLQDGMSLVPVEQQKAVLAEYDERRTHFRQWLRAHLVQGVHFGYPPGCQPRETDSLQWQSKPSLYKAGALLLVDLLKLQVAYEADQEAWQQLGGKPGQFVMRCTLINPATGMPIGEGRGVFEVGEKKMNSNAAIKMAEKRALVDAVVSSVAVCADLFTQDMEDPPPPSAQPDKDPFAANAPTRQERASGNGPVTKDDIQPLSDRWKLLALEQWPDEGRDKLRSRWGEYVNSVAGATIEFVQQWTPQLLAGVTNDLDTNKTAVPVDQRD